MSASFVAACSHRIRALSAWLPVAVWAGFIFWGSTDALSATHTSRFLTPFLHWLIPWLRDDQIGVIRMVIRKGGHMTEYAVLAVLLWRALYRPGEGARPWGVRLAAVSWLGAVAYAVSDEIHQSFHASRQASVGDVAIDAIGALLGLILVRACGRWCAWWKE